MEHRTNKKIAFYKLNDNKDYIVYDGSEYKIMTNAERENIMKKPYGYDSILVPYNGDDAEGDHKEYIKMIDDIYKITDGKINMYKTGTYANTAQCLFNSLNNNINNLEKIEEYEFDFLDNGGGVRVAESGYKGYAYKYDINSYYPSLLKSKTAKFPISAGTLIDITNEEIKVKRFVKFGVYHAEIECNDNKLFTTISSNMYTHTEINYAKKLCLNINILGKCIVWDENQLVSFHSVFNKFVDYLYPLKKQNKGLKLILNSLWGALVQKRGGVRTYKIPWADIDPSRHVIIKTNPIDDIYCMLTTKMKVYFYKSSYARINPFLLGLARVNMHKTFNKIGYDKILWSHTDSVITTCPLTSYKHIKINHMIGNWKYEGKCPKLKVINKNIVKGEFN